MGRQPAPSLQRQQTSTLRSRHKNGPGMFWKMECQERRCPHGESNSAQISGAPWSNLCVLSMLHRRRSQDNDRRNCGLNFCPEPIWVQAVRETGRMMRHILGSLLLAASVLLLAGYKGADHEQTSGSSTMSSQPAVAAEDHSQLVRRGREIFDETPRCAPSYTGANISCGDCHINSGTEPYAAPMVGLAGQFPIYSKRAGRVISLKERIQECFLGSTRQSVRKCILCGFLESDEFGLGGCQALRFQQQVIEVAVTPTTAQQRFDVSIDGFHYPQPYFNFAVVKNSFQMFE